MTIYAELGRAKQRWGRAGGSVRVLLSVSCWPFGKKRWTRMQVEIEYSKEQA